MLFRIGNARVSSLSQYLSPAYAAALALIIIQAGIGVLYKFAQHDGGYAFSPSSSITISEFLKFLLSTCFFYRECSKRHVRSPQGYSGVESGSSRSSTDEKALMSDEVPIEESEMSESSSSRSIPQGKMKISDFIFYCMTEVSSDTQYGFSKLALLYALINNTVFVLYKLADPGTIQLIKSGITLVTALVLWFTLGTKIAKLQWIAIMLQICGLVVTQYNPTTGSSYPLPTYLVLLFQTFLSAVAGVYNQKLCKSEGASLHADNMILYAAGCCANILIHIMTRFIKSSEPGFFTGYNDWGAIMVIASNVFIGLAITAVYKYADALIKCFATAVSTALLLYISPILFGVSMSAMVIPGTVVVFLATWLYLEGTPAKDPNAAVPSPPRLNIRALSRFSKSISSMTPGQMQSRPVGLSIRTVFTLFIIGCLTYWNSSSAPMSKGGKGQTTFSEISGPLQNLTTLVSPFANSLAYIRFSNSARKDRIPYAMAYAPFFHSIHISIPDYPVERNGKFYTNLTHDSWDEGQTMYQGVAETMRMILQGSDELVTDHEVKPVDSSSTRSKVVRASDPNSKTLQTKSGTDERPTSEIDGLMFYHFDAWVDPLAFSDDDFSKIWFPGGWNQAPKFHCINDTKLYPWPWWSGNHDKKALAAMQDIRDLDRGYTLLPDQQVCVGWTDIFFIPRSYFQDFVTLATIFSAHGVFLEVAIPTIVKIIDLTRQRHPHTSVINKLGVGLQRKCEEYSAFIISELADIIERDRYRHVLRNWRYQPHLESDV
ncbi:UDP-galactose transporter [Venturia nashicola]|uniref:UDP-galactose transporter n=1 Tax=Venturia nashicola TaxID=86259 RepID=A0A4Z1PBB3_9PEZI|nr:UDP-galactose transporter [Venturia nashicola]